MDTKNNVDYPSADHAMVGDHRIDVTNWAHLGKRQVRINWPSLGSVDLATAKRFAANLQAAMEVAERFSERNT